MEIVTWRGFATLARLALMGVGVAFAGVLVSLFLGFGSASAHAEDGEERGLLGAVTGTVTATTSLVGETVTGITSAATTVVESTVSAIPAPAQQPVHAVLQDVGEVAAVVVAPVEQLAAAGVVGAVTQPVLEVATRLPVIGGVVTGLGIDAAVTQVGSSVDDLLHTTVSALAATPSAIGSPRPVASAAPLAAAVIPTSTVAHPIGTFFARPDASAVPSSSASAAEETRVHASIRDDAAPDPRGALCPSSLAGSTAGGASSGAWALIGLLPFVAHRAWVRRAGNTDDDAPPSPFFATDVSPD